jgi:hypothetical protein
MAEFHVRGWIPRMNRGSGGILPQRMFEIWSPEVPFPAFWASKFALKFMLTILVFEEKKRKNARKLKKILTMIYHHLLDGDINGRRPRVRRHTPAENVWNLKPGNTISSILSIQIRSKIYANYIGFEIKEWNLGKGGGAKCDFVGGGGGTRGDCLYVKKGPAFILISNK